ncbi:MAG: hypothetical protein GY851_20515 [bacterium]|nr:hypothetical protein [bacterium]
MFSITLNSTMLSEEERDCFGDYLRRHGVDEGVWEVYACFLQTSTRATQPKVLRVYRDGDLVGAAFVAQCKAYGKSLFQAPVLHAPIDLVGLPSFIWIRVGS